MLAITEDKAKTVEELINTVNYSHDEFYIPSEFALEFVNFIKLVNGGEGEENKTPVLHYRMMDQIASGQGRLANMVHRGAAKAVTLNTKLITPTGYSLMKDIKIGDEVIDRNGLPTKVTHKSELFYKDIYEIALVDNRKIRVSEDHINIVQKRVTGKNVIPNTFKEFSLTTTDIISKGVFYNRKMNERNPLGKESKWYIPCNLNIEYGYKDFPLEPYLVGCILGDGSIDKHTGFTRFHTSKGDVNEFKSYMSNYNLSETKEDKRNSNTVRYSIKGIGKLVKENLTTNNVYSKSIPNNLLISSKEQRYELLKGLMDTDGTVDIKGNSYFSTVSTKLAYDVANLVRSLGGESKVVINNWNNKPSYKVTIKTPENCFKLKRKAERWKNKTTGRVAIESITKVQTESSQCISVDSKTRSYLINDYVVTHNTTLMGEYLFLYLAFTGGRLPNMSPIEFALYVSDSIDNGVKNMRKNLQFRWENSEFLQKYVPDVKFTDIEWKFKNINGEVFIVKGYGAKTGVRGAKAMGKRPKLAVLDDLVSDEDARSPTVIASIEETIYKAVDYALHPTESMIIWSGTPFNANDPLYKAVESGAWTVNVYPVCEHFPCERKDFKGSWEDRFNFDYVQLKYSQAVKQGKIDTFNQELMLRIMSDEDRLISDKDIKWYNQQNLMKNKHFYNFYITTDFATTEKESADYSFISVWALNNNNDWFWVDGICKKQTMDKNVNDLFRLVSKYKPQSVGIEVSGQQGGFLPWFQNEMITRNIWFNIASGVGSNTPGIRPSTNKLQRFNVVVPWFKAGKIYLPDDMRLDTALVELLEELRLVSQGGFKSKHDDAIDTVSMLGLLDTYLPSESGLSLEKNSVYYTQEEVVENVAYSNYIV